MIPEIKIIPAKKLIGKHLQMCLAENRTTELWKSFMPRRKEITNNLNAELISMESYDQSLNFKDFNPGTIFEKWAAVEVTSFDAIPSGMEAYTMQGGMYAVFDYKGDSKSYTEMFYFIFKTWLESSDYLLDKREHFEVLGEKYKNDDPDSEEEIWVPVKPKS